MNHSIIITDYPMDTMKLEIKRSREIGAQILFSTTLLVKKLSIVARIQNPTTNQIQETAML
jgi:hypothetical protein